MNITIGGKSFELTSRIEELVEDAIDRAVGHLDKAWQYFIARVEDPKFKAINCSEFAAMNTAMRNSGEFSPSSIQPIGVPTQGSPGKKSIRPKLKLAGATTPPPLGASKNLPARRKPRFL